MKFKYLILLLLFSIPVLPQTTYFIKYKESISPNEVESRLLNKSFFSESVDLPSQTGNVLNASYLGKGSAVSIPELSKIIKITYDTPLQESFLQFVNDFDENIEYMQKSNTYKIDFMPNDSLISNQWALSMIKAFDAWDINQGADSISITVIDTGIDYLHPDLMNKIFINSGEIGLDALGNDKRSNGIDDDGNGFIDDYMGWDFTDREGFPFDSTGGDYLFWDNDPKDENGFSHGTAVAGIIGAETNNTTGIAGVAPKVRILNLRAFDPEGYGEEDDVAAAIIYAVKMGTSVINMSFGDYSYSYVLRDVIRYAYSQNIVLVASAGNSASPDPHYPSGYSEVISVGNSTKDDFVASSSNYGSTLDLVAPGTSILTTIRNNRYTDFNGTSAAAPFVSAAAGLIRSSGNFSNEEIKQILKTSTDDIGAPGWDLRTGAGRLNLERALRVLSPSIVKFEYPKQDFATFKDTVNISVTVLSSYFNSFTLYLGTGLNPTNWTPLLADSRNQVQNKEIFTLNISTLPDTVYTLRLRVEQTNGINSEERVNFSIVRSPANAELISIFPALYGDIPTILASIYTEQPALVKMFYKKLTATDYNFITLDGFAINNQFVKRLHYGFIPKQLVEVNNTYQVYFEIENEAGLKSFIRNNGSDFTVDLTSNFDIQSREEMSYSLPAGYIFDKQVKISESESGVYIRDIFAPQVSHFYNFTSGEFTKSTDSLPQQILKDAGDFNKNGKENILSLWSYSAIFSEQTAVGSTVFETKAKYDTSFFWPVKVEDLDNDNQNELIVLRSDSTGAVYSINNNFTLNYQTNFRNFSRRGFGGNYFNSPNATFLDSNGDGKKEMWMIDSDGDVLVYSINSKNNITPAIEFNTGFLSSTGYLTSGDFNGDGVQDISIILESVRELDISPFFLLLTFNFRNDSLIVINEQAFINPAKEFNSGFQRAGNAIKMRDLNNDGKDEIILSLYPYAFIIESRDGGTSKIISFDENVNTTSLLVADFNQNGTPDVAFPFSNGIKFFEYGIPFKPSVPFYVEGNTHSDTQVRIEWVSNSPKYYIYKGETPQSLILTDSTSNSHFFDSNVVPGTTYFYSISGIDETKSQRESALSKVIAIYHHKISNITNLSVVNKNTLDVTFSERVNKSLENLDAFKVRGVSNSLITVNSISASSEFSYLITFKSPFEPGVNSLIVENLRDLYRAPVNDTLVTFSVQPSPEEETFYVERFKILSNYEVELKFNLPVDPATIINLSSYRFSPENKATSVSLSGELGDQIIISTKGEKPFGALGKEYTLTVSGIRSSTGTGSILLNEGAGSSIVLSSFAENLDDLFVYPNPVNLSKSPTMTFANLPRRAEIRIYTLDGIFVQSIEERDGNGGVTWNLNDLNNRVISSGVYIYRVAKLDDSNEVTDVKLGKFVVVK